jgi:hypothetical protein
LFSFWCSFSDNFEGCFPLNEGRAKGKYMGIYTFSIHGHMYRDVAPITYRPEFPSQTNKKAEDYLHGLYRGDHI